MVKILLVQPPVRDFYYTFLRGEPLGLEYIAAQITAAPGVEVRIYNALEKKIRRSIPWPTSMEYLHEYDLPRELYKHYFEFGYPEDHFIDYLKASKPDIVGISSLFTAYHEENSLRYARIIKDKFPDIITVCGGHHPTSFPQEVINEQVFDHVIIGEGEQGFYDLVMRTNDKIIDIDNITYPIRTKNGMKSGTTWPVSLLTSRGCPNKCGFCAGKQMNRGYRQRSLINVTKEIDQLVSNGFNWIDIADDAFGYECARDKEILKYIIKIKSYKLTVSAMNGLNYGYLDKEIISLLKLSGMRQFDLSLACSSPEMANIYGRDFDFNRLINVINYINIEINVYIIIGLPGDSINNINNIINKLSDVSVNIIPSVFYPIPGIGYENKLPFCLWRSSVFPVETDSLPRCDLVQIFKDLLCKRQLKKTKIGA